MNADIRDFGTTSAGVAVQRITLRSGPLTASLLTWGAVLQSLWMAGVGQSLTLGSDRLADYEDDMRYHGSLIAPVVNRFSGAQAPIAGQTHQFDRNQDNRITLHSGSAGTHLKVWDLVDATETSATLSLTLPDGEGGFPGTRTINTRFTLTDTALRMNITATTTAPTLLNPANHSYWNLDGTDSWAGHTLRIAADHYLPTTPDFTPTGEIVATAGSAHDFRNARTITPHNPALDNCFCLADGDRALTDVLWLTGQCGLEMTVATTAPGIQLYDGRNAIRPGKAGYEGIAIEAQGWPDAPNHPEFPGIELHPGQTYHQITEWRFRT